jgi:alpha-aminoadipic semialdehyde synthase
MLKQGRFTLRRDFSHYVPPPVIAIRRENLNPWERRAPLVPQHIEEFLKKHVARFLVQPCTRRVFRDEHYQSVGCEITEDLTSATLILGIKEVPISHLLPKKTYAFFSHTHKAQHQNMAMLDAIQQRHIRLIDYELMRDVKSGHRVVQFGYYAGAAGVIDFFHLLGKRLLLEKNLATPFLQLAQTVHYINLKHALEAISKAGEQIQQEGLPKHIAPFLVIFTGTGKVAQGALKVFKHFPHEMIDASDVPKWFSDPHRIIHLSNQKLYGCVIAAEDYAIPHTASRVFEKQDFYQHPQNYNSMFQKTYLPYASAIIHGLYWDPRYPRLVEKKYLKQLYMEKNIRLLGIADISCDLHGAIEITEKFTTIDRPFFIYNPITTPSIHHV